jgi:hypothetical protein
MYSGWKKNFADGTSICGEREQVVLKQVSWRNSRSEHLVSVEYYWKNHRVFLISGIGNYWQSEDYDIDIGEKYPALVTLRLQKEITEQDSFLSTTTWQGSTEFAFISDAYHSPHISVVDATMVGKWYTVEYHLSNKLIKTYFSDHRI